jgi:branched-subunit amino acid ABC-type transport system permease component
MLIQHSYNTLQVWIYYSLIAYGFYFASISCRHFNFTTALGFLAGPYVVLATENLGPTAGVAVAFAVCFGLGFSYSHLSAWLIKKGAREGQLLVISLAIMAVGENLVTMVFGNTSRSLWHFAPRDLLIAFSWITVTRQQLVYFVVGATTLMLSLVLWRKAMIGIALRGLMDSRLNLILRGYNVQLLESLAAGSGFAIVGLAGILWSIDVRVRPPMSLEVDVIGVVTFIVGPMIARGLAGLIWASFAISMVKLLMVLGLQGDWGMTSSLVLLGIGLLFQRGKITFHVGAAES